VEHAQPESPVTAAAGAPPRRAVDPPRPSPQRLAPRATVFLGLVLAVTAAVAAPLVLRLSAHTPRWTSFAILAGCAAVAQLFTVRTPANQAYQMTGVFLIAAALILPPELVVLVAAIQHLPEWLKSRYPWYIASFNVCNYTLATLAACAAAELGEKLDAFDRDLGFAVGSAAAVLAFVAVNHWLLATMLHYARGHSIRQTRLFSFESLSTDLILATLGVAFTVFWHMNPWLIPFAIAPLLLIHRALSVPQLKAEARVDPKTGLFNARYFSTALSEELARAGRFERPMSLMMADLDLLRDINNSYGHLAGDAVLSGIAEIFHAELRHYDVAARFGGEEFSILLPETATEQALEIAERIRRAVAEQEFEVDTATEPIRATISIGVSAFPKDAGNAQELIHQADLAVYRAKLQGRNRVLAANSEALLMRTDPKPRLVAVPDPVEPPAPRPQAQPQLPPEAPARPPEERRHPRPHAVHGPRFFALSTRLGALVVAVVAGGLAAGVAGLVYGSATDVLGLLAVIALVAGGQALALEVDDGSISVGAVGSLAGAAMFGPRAALAIAVTTAAVEWSARRAPIHQTLYNVGALTLSTLAAAFVFDAAELVHPHDLSTAVAGLLGGAAYFATQMLLISGAVAMEGHERWWRVFHERFAWLLPHYVVYGFVGGVIALAYHAVGLYALAVFAVPLLLMRKTQEAYLKHTQKSAQKLREAAETIQSQNISLEQANRLLKERSTQAMESLSATVDARDSYTAGHSRRVQQLSLAIGRELGLSQAELDLLGHAALFHDIGKLAVPDAVLLKPASLTGEEWLLMQRHADEGARIIDRLGFLQDAVPAIRHHHERYDGTGYPDRLKAEEIPMGARIIHVADALDSMLTTRIYRAARPAGEALAELRESAGKQFCPRVVDALERILPLESVIGPELAAAAPQTPVVPVARAS
jgi:diguanylate cyclase (GGDEF)-like protein/putative nucleotidyltransferase with HDIG domain